MKWDVTKIIRQFYHDGGKLGGIVLRLREKAKRVTREKTVVTKSNSEKIKYNQESKEPKSVWTFGYIFINMNNVISTKYILSEV